MAETLFFYDLETSGFSPREQRIMQFAGQRTDLKLKPIGEPYNFLIKTTEDILPDPDAVLLTGITPQQTIQDGISEAEFLRIMHAEIAQPGTIFTGYNSVRFDDEFMRFLHYRNYYDAYEWHWADGKSRWDLLDVVRMTRALRPDGIKWPVNSDGKSANQLEMLTSINGLKHSSAHDALSDVQATIALGQLLHSKQPKLFDFLLKHRGKKEVEKLVSSGQPFVYTSGKYPSEYEKTTVVSPLFQTAKQNGTVVYDLRHNPQQFEGLTAQKLADMWQHFCKERPCPHPRLPVKTLQYNRCPAVAPLGVFNSDAQKRLDLSMKTIETNLSQLSSQPEFVARLKEALVILDKQVQTRLVEDEIDVDQRLYDGFVGDNDKTQMSRVRSADIGELSKLNVKFDDDRLNQLLPLYKARNFPKSLSDAERQTWQRFCERRLLGGKQQSRAAKYFERLGQLDEQKDLSQNKRYLLEELQLWGQSVLPTEV